MTSHNFWYVRRNNKVVGPFPRAQIQEYLAQGKLVSRDEVSHDREVWTTIERCADFSEEKPEVKSVLHRLWYVRKDGKVSGPFPQPQIEENLSQGVLTRSDEISHDNASWTSIEHSGYFTPDGVAGKPASHHRWYVRRHSKLIGPFPHAQIAEYLMLGKLSRSDEISDDRVAWRTIQDSGYFPEGPSLVQPTEGTDEENAWEVERARAKHRWLDERLYGDGDTAPGPAAAPEAFQSLRHDHQVTQAMIQAEREQKPKIWQGIVALLVLGAIVAGVWYGGQGEGLVIAPPAQPLAQPNCSANGPGVNWTNCVKTGANLRGAQLKQGQLNSAKLDNADLSGADLSYASLVRTSLRSANMEGAALRAVDFSGADLTGANLGTSDLSYAVFTGALVDGLRLTGARLDKATWIDGRICAEGSIGTCL